MDFSTETDKESTVKLWMVRAGRHGTWENLAFENGITFVGFLEVPDLSGTKGREDILQILKKSLPQDIEKL